MVVTFVIFLIGFAIYSYMRIRKLKRRLKYELEDVRNIAGIS